VIRNPVFLHPVCIINESIFLSSVGGLRVQVSCAKADSCSDS
jgi:hypothetical protein